MVNIQVSLDGGQTITPNFDWQSLSDTDRDSYSTSPAAIILVAASFWALIIIIPGLSWHIKNRNLPAASMVGWIVYLNIINIVNALLWSNDNISTWWNGVGYCDLVIKLNIAAAMGLVGSLACIMRALAQALDTNNIRLMPTQGQRIRQLILENFLCIGLPLIMALVHFAIQPLRFYVFAISGCKVSYSNHWYTMLLSSVWPPVICMLNGYYAILLTIRIYKYRRDFSSILASSTSGMNKSRFLRLLISALTVLFVAIPTQAYALYVNAINGMDDSWSPVSWQTIVFVPMYGMVSPDCWIHIGITIPVFLCFGWGNDANSIYRAWLRMLGFTKLFPKLAGGEGLLPSSTANKKHTSFGKSDNTMVLSKMGKFFSFGKISTSHTASTLPSANSSGSARLKHSNSGDLEHQSQNIEVFDEETITPKDSPLATPAGFSDAIVEVPEHLAVDGKAQSKALKDPGHHLERSLTL